MIGSAAPKRLINMSFIYMNSSAPARQRTNLSCTRHLRSVEFGVLNSNVFLQVWRSDYAGSKASFEAQACGESSTGVGRRRIDFFASGRRVRIGSADGCSEDTEQCTESRNHAR